MTAIFRYISWNVTGIMYQEVVFVSAFIVREISCFVLKTFDNFINQA